VEREIPIKGALVKELARRMQDVQRQWRTSNGLRQETHT